MPTNDESNIRSLSANWEWRKVKLRPPPAGDGAPAISRRSTRRLPARNPRKPITIEVTYRGGPSDSWIVRYRGQVWRFDGFVCLTDLMSVVNGPIVGVPVRRGE